MLLIEAAQLAGLFTAHAIRFLADGETLHPMLGVQMPDGSKTLRRLVEGEPDAIVAESQKWLAANPENAASAVLIYDGYINMEEGTTDAILLEARHYADKPTSFGIAIPYHASTSATGFGLLRPKFIALQELEQETIQDLVDRFYKGVETDEKGAAIWNAHLAEEK